MPKARAFHVMKRLDPVLSNIDWDIPGVSVNVHAPGQNLERDGSSWRTRWTVKSSATSMCIGSVIFCHTRFAAAAADLAIMWCRLKKSFERRRDIGKLIKSSRSRVGSCRSARQAHHDGGDRRRSPMFLRLHVWRNTAARISFSISAPVQPADRANRADW